MNTTIKKRIEEINSGRVPEGYEKTSFGIYPCDWEKVSLGEVSAKKGEYGLNAPACEYKEGLPKYLRITDIDDQGRYIDNNACVNDADSRKYVLNKGDIVFARTGASVGKNYIYDEKDGILVYAGFLIKFSIKPQYNAYLICSNCRTKKYDNWVAKMCARSGQPGINAEEYATYSFIIPKSSQEQSRIAEILMQWDKAIELQEKYIKQLELRKKALMQRLLTPKEGWKKTSLKEVLIERVELASKKNEFVHVTLGKEGVVDKTAQYNRDFLVKNDDKLYKITRFNDMCYNPANLKFGVICVNKYGTAIFSPIYITFSVNEGFNVDFIGEILSSANFIEMIRKYEEGTVYERQAVKPSDFLKGIIFVPEKKVQDRIALLIAMINKDLDLQTQKLDNLIKQRKALQQYLLTGIVRV